MILRKCKVHGECDFYHRKHRGRDEYTCKLCVKARTKERYELKSKEIIRKVNEYRLKHKTETNTRNRASYRRNHSKRRATAKIWVQNNQNYIKESRALDGLKKKQIVFLRYGDGKIECRKCLENDIRKLCLDHLNNDGAKHRQQGLKGEIIYRWTIKNNFPPIFQILCFNCNFLKSYTEKTTTHQIAYRKIKQEIISHYSPENMCDICKISDIRILSIDHINGNGSRHRRELGVGAGPYFYWWLKRNRFPDDYRVLCLNCNCSKHLRLEPGEAAQRAQTMV